ncbi:MAG: C cytochrome precursor [Planctomycetes bacterium]|nr:C cytochrome precursor [Planctomycetota bacterium]
MILSQILFAALFASVCAALVLPWALRSPRRLPGIAALALIFLVALLCSMSWQGSRAVDPFYALGEHEVSHRPVQRARDGYVGSQACAACHPDQHGSWKSSFHASMAQLATPETVLGDFGDVELEDLGRKVRFFRKGEEFWMAVDEPAAQGGRRKIERKVVMTTGSHHHQAYWFEPKEGRSLGTVPFIWSIERQRWIPYEAGFLMPQDEKGVDLNTGAWNKHCMKCHATHGALRFDPPAPMETTVVELGISCESCHGPAEEHVAKFSDPLARYAARADGGIDTGLVDATKLDHRRSSDVCAQCHSVNLFMEPAHGDLWNQSGYPYRPGDVLAETKYVARFLEGEQYPSVRAHLEREAGKDPHWWQQNFWSDGQVLVTGREFNGLQMTPCYERGTMSCLSCHEMHPDEGDPRSLEEWRDDQLRLGMRGNAACTSCHPSFLDPNALTQHTRHAPESPGSQCMSCHMPHTTYGLLKAISSHTLTSPDVKVELATTRPNACNLCHLDRPLAWAAEELQRGWGVALPETLDEDHRNVAAGALWALKGHALQRAIVAWHMGWPDARKASGTEWVTPFLVNLLDDPYDAVRQIADRSLRSVPGTAPYAYDPLAPSDQRRAASARVLADWSSASSRSGASVRPHVLLDASGSPQREEFSRLLRARDPRRILIAE